MLGFVVAAAGFVRQLADWLVLVGFHTYGHGLPAIILPALSEFTHCFSFVSAQCTKVMIDCYCQALCVRPICVAIGIGEVKHFHI